MNQASPLPFGPVALTLALLFVACDEENSTRRDDDNSAQEGDATTDMDQRDARASDADQDAQADADRDAAEPPQSGEGKTCGGLVGATCAEGEYCDLGADCKKADVTGTCTPKPSHCDLIYDPVCGCDGRTYGNACSAASAGMSVLHRGECSTPETSHCAGNDGPLAEGECWTHADCADGQRCVGAMCCPPNADCFAPDMPGKCE